MQILVIFSLIIAIIAVIFAVQNAGDTTVKFLIWQGEIPLALGLFIAVLLGSLISLFASIPSITRNKMANRKLRKQTTEIEKTLQLEQSRLVETQDQLQEMENLKAKVSELEEKLAVSQQRIQVLEGRLALELKKSGITPPDNINPSGTEA